MKVIKLDIGYKPDLTIEKVLEIFKENFEHEVLFIKENSFCMKRNDSKMIGAKISLKQKNDKTILKIRENMPFSPLINTLLITTAFFFGFGCWGPNIILAIFLAVTMEPKLKEFLDPLKDFAKNHPEFK